MNLFSELRRRNVFKVGTAYLVGAWLMLQFADMLLDNVGAPAWVWQAIMVVLAIGFFITLFAAWAFELTPEGIKRESEVDRSLSITARTGKKLNNAIVVLLVLAVAYLLFDKFSGPGAVSTPPVDVAGTAAQQNAEPAAEATPVINRQSIAVLPFDNRSPDPADAYFTDGIHDDLLTNLSRVSALKVISRTSVTQYKGTEKTIPQIAQELGVAHVMEGAVQRAGNQVRINVQLIDAQTDEHLWAEIFDRELTAENLFAIQSEISQAIADALQATLTTEEQEQLNRVPTQNLLAYESFLKGKQLEGAREAKALEQALAEFRKAVDLDPEFALAWVGLADSTFLSTRYGTFPRMQSIELADTYIQRALALDDRLGEAYASMAQVYWFREENAKAEEAQMRAMELSPNYATSYHWYSNALKAFPLRIDDAIEYALKAVELDPNSPVIRTNLAHVYQNKGLYSMAERAFLDVIQMYPDFAQAYNSLAGLYAYSMGRFPDGIDYLGKAIEMAPDNIFQLSSLADFLLELGDVNAANAVRDRMAELDSNHLVLGYQDVQINRYLDKHSAVRENIEWSLPRLSGLSSVLNLLAQISATIGDLAKARDIYLAANPGWQVETEWAALINEYPTDACIVAWLFLRAGDEAIGEALLADASKFLEEDLPAVMEHPDEFMPQVCQAAQGDFTAALSSMETVLKHNHLFFWRTTHLLPMFDPIRDDPRYLALDQRYQQNIATQRAEYERRKETGP
jgi:TolB-like protein/Tfp pilus assembly protein PilF